MVKLMYHIFTKGGENNMKLRMRKMREPVLGDKLASMHGQKGVVGMILPQVEMPLQKMDWFLIS